MSEPRLTQTNHFGHNERGAQIGHLENAFFNFSMREDPTGSGGGSDVETENRCLRSLASKQIYVSRHSGKRVPGTGDWVLENHVYKAWQQNGGILWIKGRAGCGKSTLVNHLSSEAEKQALENPNETVLSHNFVFGKGESLQRSPAGLFRGLLHQILAMDRDLLTRFTKATGFAAREKQQAQAGVAWDWSPSELHEQLDDICKRKFCQSGKTHFYVDCLDACSDEDATEILEWLTMLTSETGTGVRICFSSRPYPKWNFDNFLYLNLEELNQSDMVSYLEFHLQKLKKPSLRGHVVKEEDLVLIKGRLLDRASSVFQWLKYAIRQATELLQGGESVNYVLDVLENCPQDLDDVYASIVEQIPRQETDVAFRLLEWITLAQAPLSVEALRHAVCIDRPYRKGASIHDFEKPDKYWCETDDILVSRAERLTRGLVRLQKIVVLTDFGFAAEETELQVLQYDHDSVSEFFAFRGLQMLAGRMGTDFVISRCHLHLTQRCLAYLLTREGISTAIEGGLALNACFLTLIANPNEDLLPNVLNAVPVDAEEAIPSVMSPLLTKYAVQYWQEHYRIAESDDAVIDECSAFLHSVCGPDLWKVEIWCYLPNYFHYIERLDSRDGFIDLICSLGFMSTLKRLLSRPTNESKLTTATGSWRDILNAEGPYGQTPLIAAIRGRDHSIVELLLQHGVSASVFDRHGIPPLHHAVQSGQADIVDRLLASPDVDPDERGNTPYSPLMLALEYVTRDHTDEGQRILESLVQSTKQSVHSTMVTRESTPTPDMLARGWPLCFTPLANAWQSASGNVLKTLLKCPLIDSSAQDSLGRTLAHYIAGCNISTLPDDLTEELAQKSRILFDSGRVELNSKDSQGNTPLVVAVTVGDAPIVSMLLAKKEVDANSKNNEGHTPLMIAGRAGKVEVLEMLLACKKVDRHAVDYKGNNALVGAVVGGVLEAVRLLMSTGQFNPHEQSVRGISPVHFALYLAQEPDQDRKAERIAICEFLIRS